MPAHLTFLPWGIVPAPAPVASSSPDKRRRYPVPPLSRCFHCVTDLPWLRGVLPVLKRATTVATASPERRPPPGAAAVSRGPAATARTRVARTTGLAGSSVPD